MSKPEFARPIVATWPAYRVSNSQFKTMQWRINDCYRQMRYPEPKFASTPLSRSTRISQSPRASRTEARNEAMKVLLALGLIPLAVCAQDVQKVLRDFQPRGQATMDRVVQDGLQRVCTESNDRPPAELAKQLEADQLKSIAFPQGSLMGDWKNASASRRTARRPVDRCARRRRRRQLLQLPPALTAGSFTGTLGPSLLRFGATRGNSPDMQR